MRRLLLVPVVALVVAGCGSGKPAEHPATPAAVSTQATPAVVDSATVMTAWYDTGPKDALSAIGADLSAMKSAGLSDLPALSVACVNLKGDVDKMQQLPPPPVQEVADPWTAALTTFATAATECAEGAQPPADYEMLSQMNEDLTTGAASLNQATRALTAFVG